MTREELLRSKEYWVFQIQNGLFNVIENYRKNKNINKTQLAQELGFHKSYITQVLNGDYDHKVSKLVELALASGSVPIVSYVDLKKYIKDDAENKKYTITTTQPRSIEIVHFSSLPEEKKKNYEHCDPKKITNADSKETYSIA